MVILTVRSTHASEHPYLKQTSCQAYSRGMTSKSVNCATRMRMNIASG